MNTLCLVTHGYLPGRTPISIITAGYIGCGGGAVAVVYKETVRFILYIMQNKGFDLER